MPSTGGHSWEDVKPAAIGLARFLGAAVLVAGGTNAINYGQDVRKEMLASADKLAELGKDAEGNKDAIAEINAENWSFDLEDMTFNGVEDLGLLGVATLVAYGAVFLGKRLGIITRK